MAINGRLQRLLDRTHSGYAVLPHREVFTAQEVAESASVRGQSLAKVVVLRDLSGADLMLVLPASQQCDARAVEAVTGRSAVRLEAEYELVRLFPDCEPGAMPPFGSLYGLPMYVDPCLLQGDDIFFQAGNHREIVLMRRTQFEEIAGPFHGTACLHRAATSEVRHDPECARVTTRRVP